MEGLWANALPCVASGIEMDAADIIPGSDDHPPEPEPNRRPISPGRLEYALSM